MQLKVSGLVGGYVFCLAVLVSLLLSTFVDSMDERARRMERGLGPEASASEESKVDARALRIYGRAHSPRPWHGPVMVVLAVACVFVVVFAAIVPTTIRVVPGSIPAVLEILGVDFTQEYSLWSLCTTIGAVGGWNIFLELVLAIFIIGGPFGRAFLELVLVAVPLSPHLQGRIVKVVNDLGSFSAWKCCLLQSSSCSCKCQRSRRPLFHRPRPCARRWPTGDWDPYASRWTTISPPRPRCCSSALCC